MSLTLRIALFGITALLFAGCYPYSPTYTNDYDLVATNYNSSFDFSSNRNYHLPTKIVKITSSSTPSNGDDIIYVNSATATLIFNQIRTNLNNNGWTETDSLNADVIILPVAFENTQVVQYYNPWYWGWYGYGWGYPGYYPGYGYTTSTYKTGTLMLSMTYPAGVDNDQIPVQWTCIINGLLDSGGSTGSSSTGSRITQSINQAFTQSPYLK